MRLLVLLLSIVDKYRKFCEEITNLRNVDVDVSIFCVLIIVSFFFFLIEVYVLKRKILFFKFLCS